jgi:uncharacterized membrane protein YozB (DUF420 family)
VIKFLPSLNALFNALSFLFLLLGFVNIKKKNVEAHKKFMLSAFVSSSLFLVGYLTYHYSAGVTRFKETGLLADRLFDDFDIAYFNCGVCLADGDCDISVRLA